MSSSAHDADHAYVEPEFTDIAAELYALRPDEFVAARDERVRRARAGGNRALARELSGLRRPTQSAWLVNVLRRDSGELVEELLDLAADLAEAQHGGGARDLQDLTTRRRRLEATLLDRAGELAEAAGVRASADTVREVQETLAAALSLPDVAAEVRSGTLVRPASYAGFGTISPQKPPAPRPPPRRRDEPTGVRARREQAERRVDEARATAESAAATVAERETAAAAAEQRVAELRDRVEELRRQLRELERDTAAAEREVEAESRRRDRAKEADQRARQALESAERQLEGQ